MRPHIRATQALLVEVLWADGLPIREIAERANLTPSQVASYVTRHRDACPPRYAPAERHERMRELWATELTVAEIAETLGMNPITVSSYAYHHRDLFPHRKPGKRRRSYEMPN